jgi:hypothetical protein
MLTVINDNDWLAGHDHRMRMAPDIGGQNPAITVFALKP